MANLLGTQPNQVPTNGDLGNLAFQNKEAASIDLLALPNGAAKGVLYLDSNKITTSGSALTFDGVNLGIGNTSPGARLDIGVTGDGTVNALRLNNFTNSGSTGVGIAFSAINDSSMATITNNYQDGALSFGISTKESWSGTLRTRYGILSTPNNGGVVHSWFGTGGVLVAKVDTAGNFSYKINSTASTPPNPGMMTFELTSNTSLKIIVRGSDGVTRSATLALV